jgi:hypothetical protein
MPDGEIRWVSSSALKTKDEAAKQDIAAGIVGLGAAIVVCSLDPKSCQSSNANSSNSAKASGATVRVTNSCDHPLQLLISLQDADDGKWKSRAWYSLSPQQSGKILFDGREVRTYRSDVYFYAETTDSSNIVWKGDYKTEYGSEVYETVRKDINNTEEKRIELTC